MKTQYASQSSYDNSSNAAKTVDFGLLGMFIFSMVADSVIMPKLIDWNDPLITTSNIIASHGIYRLGILNYLLVLMADLVVAWGLYFLLKHVNKALALLMSFLRVVFVVLRLSAMPNLLRVLSVIQQNGLETKSPHLEVMSYLQADKAGCLLALIFFGFHIFLLAYLIYKSDFIPKILGVVLFIAFLGYMINCLSFFFISNYAAHETIFMMTMIIPEVVSELSLCIWLMAKGLKLNWDISKFSDHPFQQLSYNYISENHENV